VAEVNFSSILEAIDGKKGEVLRKNWRTGKFSLVLSFERGD